MRNPRIEFTITEKEKSVIELQAKAKGLTPSQYAKNLIFRDIAKSPAKSIFTVLDIKVLEKYLEAVRALEG